MSYEQKYLKYKQKYLSLKKRLAERALKTQNGGKIKDILMIDELSETPVEAQFGRGQVAMYPNTPETLRDAPDNFWEYDTSKNADVKLKDMVIPEGNKIKSGNWEKCKKWMMLHLNQKKQ